MHFSKITCYRAFFKACSIAQCLVNKIRLQPGHCTLGIHAAFQMVKFCMGLQYRTCAVSMVLQRRRTLNTERFCPCRWDMLHIFVILPPPPANKILMAASLFSLLGFHLLRGGGGVWKNLHDSYNLLVKEEKAYYYKTRYEKT